MFRVLSKPNLYSLLFQLQDTDFYSNLHPCDNYEAYFFYFPLTSARSFFSNSTWPDRGAFLD